MPVCMVASMNEHDSNITWKSVVYILCNINHKNASESQSRKRLRIANPHIKPVGKAKHLIGHMIKAFQNNE